MKRFLLPALAAAFVLACSPGGKLEPEIPFVNPTDKTDEGSEGETTTPSVVTGNATEITAVGALIDNNSYANVKGSVLYGVVYGTSKDNLDLQTKTGSSNQGTGTFRRQLTDLEAQTTYYYKAFIIFAGTSGDETLYGEVKSFTTPEASQGGGGSGQSVAGLQYLNGYEIPAIALTDQTACYDSGQETWGSTKWYNYLTTNANQRVVTHTYSYDGKQYRNWTGLIDQDKKSPLWIAFPMHKDAYPANEGVGRKGNWTYKIEDIPYNNTDPGIPESWQKSVASNTYSRGHFLASNYRQTTDDANWQTFYWTNQSLQFQNGFNSGIWSSLEQAVVDHAPSGRDSLYVVVGVLFKDPNKIISTNQGTNELAASHFYKCLMKCSFDTSGTMTAAKGCAYIFTNEAHSGTYSQGITSIDDIEQQSGWDFFANVPTNLQTTAEAQSTALW